MYGNINTNFQILKTEFWLGFDKLFFADSAQLASGSDLVASNRNYSL